MDELPDEDVADKILRAIHMLNEADYQLFCLEVSTASDLIDKAAVMLSEARTALLVSRKGDKTE